MPYDGDSFFTLAPLVRMGLVVLALALWAVFALAARRLPGNRTIRLVAAMILIWAFVWLSPQAFYAYYRLIFDGLPAQIVTGPPPGPLRLFRLLTFTEEHSLSRHAQGVLGWSLLVLAWRSPSSGSNP